MPSPPLCPEIQKTCGALLWKPDEDSRSILQDILGEFGITFSISWTIAEALDILQAPGPPKILIVDWSIDAIALCQMLRSDFGEYYPYVLVTGSAAHQQEAAHARESGADDFVCKPIVRADMRARLSVALRIVNLQDNLISARDELRVRATKDSLTGLYNRTAFLDLFQGEMDRAARSRFHTGLLLLDLDHFKEVNDTFGHIAGDQILMETARRLKRAVRSYDIVGRYGGEEFCIVFSRCSERELRDRAEAIRLSIANEPVFYGAARVKVTTSIGGVVAFANAWSTEEMIAAADVALYRAKHAGRNCTVCCRRRLSDKINPGEMLKEFCAGCYPGCSSKCLIPKRPFGPSFRLA